MAGVATNEPADVMNPSATNADAGKGLSIGALAAAAAIALAGMVFAIGMQLLSYDAQRSHIPGHWLYFAFVFLPGFVQLAYVLPAWRAARKRHKVAIARGLVTGAGVVLALNLAMIGFLAWVGTSLSGLD